MKPDFSNISSHNNKDIDNQKLLDYLNNKLSGQEKHEMEKLMADSNFMNDAIEGLQQIDDKKKLQAYVDQLNQELHNQLQKKKLRREKRRLPEYSWIYFTIVLILILCIVAYLIISKLMHH